MITFLIVMALTASMVTVLTLLHHGGVPFDQPRVKRAEKQQQLPDVVFPSFYDRNNVFVREWEEEWERRFGKSYRQVVFEASPEYETWQRAIAAMQNNQFNVDGAIALQNQMNQAAYPYQSHIVASAQYWPYAVSTIGAFQYQQPDMTNPPPTSVMDRSTAQ